MEYNGYLIEEDKTGYAPKHLRFSFFTNDGEKIISSGESIEDCEKQIDELNLEEIHIDYNLLKTKQKKVMLSKKENFIKNMPRFTSCKTAYKTGFQDALKWIKENPEYL